MGADLAGSGLLEQRQASARPTHGTFDTGITWHFIPGSPRISRLSLDLVPSLLLWKVREILPSMSEINSCYGLNRVPLNVYVLITRTSDCDCIGGELYRVD